MKNEKYRAGDYVKYNVGEKKKYCVGKNEKYGRFAGVQHLFSGFVTCVFKIEIFIR